MGYMRHHAILVTTFNEQMAQEAHEKAIKIFGPIVSPLNESITNGYWSFAVWTFAVFPDGSKEGWQDSHRGDEGREQLKAWLETTRYEDGGSRYHWVEVQYGDDRHETKIVSSDEDARQEESEKDEEIESTLDDTEVTDPRTLYPDVLLSGPDPKDREEQF